MPPRDEDGLELDDVLERQAHEHAPGRRTGSEIVGALCYVVVTLAVSYYTLHPEALRDLLMKFGGRRPMPARLARTERIVSDFMRELAAWEHARREEA